jgi:XRE family transcriptional regulator, stress-response regulator
MVLLRHLLGDVLRRLRLRQGRTLREVSASARVSLGYLSEVERGQKEASSELLSAICTALDTPLSHVLREVSDNFALAELQNSPVLTGPREPVLSGAREPVLHHASRPALERVEAQDAALGGARLTPGRPKIGPAEPPLVAGESGFDNLGHHGDVSNMVPV